MKNFAVILSGCGYLDGAEIRESVLTLLALDSMKVSYDMFSINQDQYHVVNHLTGEVVNDEKRNTLVEAARIARGAIQDVSNIDVNQYDGLIIPGGFGVAKNLSSFAFAGINATINPAILTVINDFASNKKPIGAICISPVLIALSLGHINPVITLGRSEELASEIEKTGASHQPCKTSDCIVDKHNKIVTTPAYMDEGVTLDEIYSGISKLVKSVIELS